MFIFQPAIYPHAPAPPQPASEGVQIINMPSPVSQPPTTPLQPQPQPLQPLQPQYPYYMPPPPNNMFMPPDQSEKISKLKNVKERLTNQVTDLENELREANHENNLLQKQCREFERQLEKLSDAVERERQISATLRDQLSTEKIKTSKLAEDLQKENHRVSVYVNRLIQTRNTLNAVL